MTDERYPLALPQGSILAGQYIVEQVLGQGGFGITYKALDHKSGARVAVKEFFPDSMATRNGTTVMAFSGERGESFAYGKACFLQEAETLAEFIGNENIVRVYSYFEENQTAYYVMDFVEGTSFDNYIKDHGGRIRYEEAEKILLPVIDALAVVHRRGIIHRDVTPDNIYITKDGTVKLLDFGAARYSLGDKSRSLDVILKHGFAPKEQYTRRGKQGGYTDVYSLGASFYFAITGRRPLDSIDRLEEDELIPPGNLGVSIPVDKEEAILKAMNVQPSERFQNMEAFRDALLSGDIPQASQPVQPQPVNQPVQRIQPPPQPVNQPVQPPPQPVNQPIQPPPQPVSQPIQPKKKNTFLWAGIGAGAAVVVVVLAVAITVAVSSVNKRKTTDTVSDDNKAHYDLVEDDGSDPSGMQNSGQDVEPEPESQKENPEENQEDKPEKNRDIILGNTPDNIARYGQIAVSSEGVAIAYPGGHGLVYMDADGDARFLDDTGYIRCISIIDDTVYYINTGTACRVNLDGTNKEMIPQLDTFEKIATLYVSDQYYYIFKNDDIGLYCIDKDKGLMGTIACNGSDGLTFLDGDLYYLPEDDPSNLYRVPADDFGMEPELVLGEDDIYECYELASEGNCIYGLCEDDIEDSVCFFQYDVSSDEICWYSLSKESWPGYFSSVNVADQYVYFVYEDDSGGSAVYRFDTGTDDEYFAVDLVYEGTVGQYFEYLSLLKDEQLVSVCSWGNCHEIIVTNMDGTDEPVIIDDREMESNE